MRFATSLFPARSLRLSGNADDWPMGLRLAVVIVPACICIALAATWMGYNAASSTLAESLEALPLMKARVQAAHLNRTYTHLRRSLERIARTSPLNAQEVERRLEIFFQDSFPLLGEFGLYSKNGNSFLLLRDGRSFREIKDPDSASGDHSLFQQAAGLPLVPGKTTLLPVVFSYSPSRESTEQPRKVPVIRMALPLADGSGVLVAGIDLDSLQKTIGVHSRVDSSSRHLLQDDQMQVSYFFDYDGWILFEMTGNTSGGFLPDMARRGYTGDLGRPGYDAAFRPWGVHEDYWRMITEVKANRSGSSAATAEHFSSSAQARNRAFLCYAPVYFSPSDAFAPQLVGGIAFFETSNLPLFAFLRVANVSLFIVAGVVAILGTLVMLMGRRLGRPLRAMAAQIKDMEEGGEFLTLETASLCMEHQTLLAAANSLISRAMAAQTSLERIQREVLHARASSPVDLSQMGADPPENTEFDLVGSSSLINEVREQVRKAARAGTDVLIWGETGTGKELVAAAIHKASSRSDGPSISINCGALDESLLMDTLFGHVKGAFTEARTERKGAFLSADGGTLLLDEVANASPKVQQALLRALSVRRIRPLGSDVEASFNTRVVAATNVDLRECVRAGTFREDLYYRLAIISIETPPLRHRKEDIPRLAAFCIREAAEAMDQPEARLSHGALELMAAHDWPGNVRELKNCLTRAMAFVEGDLILPRHIVLEQDAFRAYGRPLPPQILAGRFTAEDFREPATDPPGRGQWGPAKAGAAFRAGERAVQDSEGGSGDRGRYSPLGEGHAAEYLWPAPPREVFTPARAENAFTPDDAAPSGGESGGENAVAGKANCDDSDLSRADPASLHGGVERSAANFAPPVFSSPSLGPRDAGQSGLHAASYVPPHAGGHASDPANPAFDVPWVGPFSSTASLNERQLRGLEFLRANGAITRAQYEEAAGREFSSRTAQNDLKELVELGFLERVGAGPGVRYMARRHLGDI